MAVMAKLTVEYLRIRCLHVKVHHCTYPTPSILSMRYTSLGLTDERTRMTKRENLATTSIQPFDP